MISIGKWLDQDVLDELECPICLEYMAAPIKMCESGHCICNSCRPKLNNCPTCKQSFINVRNFALENLAIKTLYPCRNSKFGCSDVFTLELVKKHEVDCIFGSNRCPFSRTFLQNCDWRGPINGIRKHIENNHAGSFCNVIGSTKLKLPLYSNEIACYAVMTFEDFFCVYWVLRNDVIYMTVLYFGVDNNNYNYSISVTREESGESTSTCLRTSPFTSDINDVLKDGTCVTIHKEILQYLSSETVCISFELEITPAL